MLFLSYKSEAITSAPRFQIEFVTMAAESHGGMQHEKREHSLTVYSSPFPNAAIVSGALSTSEDGEICLITEIGVHLLVSFSYNRGPS